MARKVSAKNIVGLAFIGPILVLIVFMAILFYVFLIDRSVLGNVVLYLLIPVLGVPALILFFLSLGFTSKNANIKWLWSIPLGAVATAIALSILLVSNQVNIYEERCESYASYYVTLNYLKDAPNSTLQVYGNPISNPGIEAYNILKDVNLIKAENPTFHFVPNISWKVEDCSIVFTNTGVVCERTMTINNATSTYRMHYDLLDSSKGIADKLQQALYTVTE